MAKKVKSLQEQMAELSSAAPGDADLDLEEDGYDAVRNEGDGSEEDIEDEARNHARRTYAEMAPSRLRKRANHIEGVDADQMRKYEGIKSSRKEMMTDSEGEGSSIYSEGGESINDESDQSTESEDVEEKDGGERTTSKTTAQKSRVHFEEGQKDAPVIRLNAAQSDAQMIQDLRKRSREDAEKGRDSRVQMNLWSKLLGSRIRGQKVVRGAGRIPSKAIKELLPNMQELDRKAYDSTMLALDELSSHLFLVQQNVLQSFTGAASSERNLVSNGLSSMKATLEEISQPIESSSDVTESTKQHIDTLLQLDQVVFEPLWRGVLARWTSRTSVIGIEGGQRNKFENSLKAMNQSAEDQIDRGLKGDTFERLRKRTRVWRGTEQESRIRQAQTTVAEDDSDNEGEKEEEEADIFDDSDFYQAMLRELIDSRGGSSTIGTDGTDSSFAWAQAAKRAAKKNTNADLRASKGRKLRYDVLEKVEHFMPPVPRETWSQDQVERLFRQLKQSNQSVAEAEKDGNSVAEGGKVDLAGLRLFG